MRLRPDPIGLQSWAARRPLAAARQARLYSPRRDLRTRIESELAEDVADIPFDRAFRHHHLLGDHSIGFPLGDAKRNVSLASGQATESVLGKPLSRDGTHPRQQEPGLV